MNQREVQNYIEKRFPGYVAISKAAMPCREWLDLAGTFSQWPGQRSRSIYNMQHPKEVSSALINNFKEL